MKVSIITSCYNRVSTIEDTIKSVLSQDYSNIEYIIIDGGSTDGTLEIIKQYEDKITRIVSEPDHGMYEAINKGIRLATGDIIGLVHSDDFLFDRHTISDIVTAFECTRADFIYGDGLFVDYYNIKKPIRKWIGGHFSKRKIRLGWLPLHPTCYIRRDKQIEVGLYNEKYKIAADTDFLIRALYEHSLEVDYINRYIIRMRMGGLSTDRAHRKAMWKEDISIYSSHGFQAIPTKIMKMIWKLPQFISAKFMK
ncbi:glycosyltransferase [Prevotella sp. A2931]|uniref:Glycosyltransferase n=1 Tax=Prevotella illustrans TaxID=2800387 RepID=A0ABS3M469_9BACT|nr:MULTISPECIES: glycosyltransferase family 2 protein [Prevotella]MBO1362881.1 glycosyltransferase [Prevotella illustrans]PTL25945.1 glycosyltransferase [Prevotella sp. oral taxon 820]